MDCRIELLLPKYLTGMSIFMSFAENKTGELWKKFMPLRKTIGNASNRNLYSLQVYPPGFFTHFNPHAPFEKWALIETNDSGDVPEGLQSFQLPGGLYAVFNYRGSSADATTAFQYILGDWLPHSPYLLDDRPHFELLGEKYKNGDPDSQEEIWIPIISK